ncbi:MAG TPA: UDP-glucose 4-epimerase GalE [Anaerolineales bacterium]
MNILITGGAGYIGSAVAEALQAAGDRVTVYDSLVTGHRAAVPQGCRFVEADLADREALGRAFGSESYDAVVHCAASIEPGESMLDPAKYFRNNLGCSIELLEAATQAGVGRLVFSSTAAVYAGSDDLLTEEAPIDPANLYGQTKWMIEQALEWYRRIRGLRYCALRYFNAAGAVPGRGEAHRPESHLIPLVLGAALGRLPHAEIFGVDYPTADGTCVRDYIHIEDLVDAHRLALSALASADRLVYNLGNGTGHSVRQVIETARRVTGHPIPARESPRRAGDAPRLVASSEKIRRELGWRPRHPGLEEIIASAWAWHRSHPDGYGAGRGEAFGARGEPKE